MKLPITAIILTYNEEKNIVDCLESLKDWIDEIILVDSYSTDETLKIAINYTDKIFQHRFDNYSVQRNWALDNLVTQNDWILNLDADHRITFELKRELIDIFSRQIAGSTNGFLVSRKTIFMNKWIKHGGHYPTYHAMLFRKSKGRCEEKSYDQHFVVQGGTLILNGDVIDIITDSLSSFIGRHNKWATLEAEEAVGLSKTGMTLIIANKNGNPIEQRRYQKNRYYKMPLFLRAILYFLYRYIFKLGFLDGKAGLIFHFLQCLWFRFLVDAKIYEFNKNSKHIIIK